MSNHTVVEELRSWEEEHIEHLEDEIEKLREENKVLRAMKPSNEDYKALYEEVCKKLQAFYNEEIPF